MSADALFWAGLATAVSVGLALCLIVLQKRRADLTAAQQMLTAQATETAVAHERNAQLQAELSLLQQTLATLQADLSAQTATLTEREANHQNQIKWAESSRTALKAELESIGQKLLSASGKTLETTNQKSLDSLLKPLGEKIDQFQTRVNQVHTDMIRNSASLSEQVKHLESVGLSMSGEANNLTRALKGDKKLVGNWGEAQLEKTLELAGLRRGEHFDAQVAFRDERGDKYLPDFIIRLPEGKNLIVDSKVSLVDYERAVAAATRSRSVPCALRATSSATTTAPSGSSVPTSACAEPFSFPCLSTTARSSAEPRRRGWRARGGVGEAGGAQARFGHRGPRRSGGRAACRGRSR